MAESSYTIRNYRPADFNDYVRLCQEAEKLEPVGRPESSPAIAEKLSRPNYSPEQDLFVIVTAGSLIGGVDISPELGIGRVILECWLHPEHRRQGLARKLLGYAMHRARELGAGVAHVNIGDDNAAAREVLSRLGFQCVRQYLDFVLDLGKLQGHEAGPVTLEYRLFQRGDEEKLTCIQNRCFTGSWGYNPNTVATITYRTRLRHPGPQDIVMAYEGDRVIGYCWAEITGSGGRRVGKIYRLGVDPDYRGRGIGRGLLLAGLARLKDGGIRVAGLTVDGENKAACVLYHSVGFEVRSKSLWYEKAVA